VTADHFSGVAGDEIDDPRVTAEILRQWSTFHPEFSFLPRKFKIAVNGAARDRAAIRWHDIGIQIVRLADGSIGYDIYAGGGMGPDPGGGPLIRAGLPRRNCCPIWKRSCASTTLWPPRQHLQGTHQDLVREIGAPEFIRQVEEEWPADPQDRRQPSRRGRSAHPPLLPAAALRDDR